MTAETPHPILRLVGGPAAICDAETGICEIPNAGVPASTETPIPREQATQIQPQPNP